MRMKSFFPGQNQYLYMNISSCIYQCTRSLINITLACRSINLMDLSLIKPSKSRRNGSNKPKKQISISKDTLRGKQLAFQSHSTKNILKPSVDQNRLYKPAKLVKSDSAKPVNYKQIKNKKNTSAVTVISSPNFFGDSGSKGFLTSQVSAHVTKQNSWCHAQQFAFTTTDRTDCVPATNVSIVNSHTVIATINDQRTLLVVPRHYDPCGAIERLTKRKEPHMVRLFDKEDTISVNENVDIYFRWKVWCS